MEFVYTYKKAEKSFLHRRKSEIQVDGNIKFYEKNMVFKCSLRINSR